MDSKSPLRSVSNVSSQTDQQISSTVQVKPKKGSREDGTPEWRRRLVRGEVPGEQRDLFAPIGLESVFKPPSPGSETGQHDAIPVLKHADPLWIIPDSGPEQVYDTHTTEPETKADNLADETASSAKKEERTVAREITKEPEELPESPGGTVEIHHTEGDLLHHSNRNHEDVLHTDMHSRSASGLEDLRNEGITPIFITLGSESRPESRASDSILPHPQADLQDDGLLDVTSHSLPRDLTVGTLDFGGRRPFVNFRRGQYLSDGSFHKHRLSPSSFPSQRLSPSALGNSRIRSSPPFYHRPQRSSKRPSSSQARVSVNGSPESKAAAMHPFESPLKLFGNHDTFTNNKLLRRMSQFEESLSGEDEPVSPSEEVRRKGEGRSALSARQRTPGDRSTRRSERPTSRNARGSHVGRFGNGQLDGYDFSDTSPYEPKMLNYEYEEAHLYARSRRRSSAGRRFLRPTSLHEYSPESRVLGVSSSRRRRSRIRQSLHDSSRVNAEFAAEEYYDYSDGKRIPNSPTKDPHPKRRRTLPRSESPHRDNDDANTLHMQIDGDVSLLERSLMHHGLADDEGGPSSRSRASPINRTLSPTVTDNSLRRGIPLPAVKVTSANEELRKESMTTLDFYNEATKIMDRIRANGRTTGGLPEVEGSDLGSEHDAETYDDDSTEEAFSRPPSRDGVDMRRLRKPQEPNPRVLSHLMKFQEKDDLEFAVSASVTSLHLDRKQGPDDHSEGSLPNIGRNSRIAVDGNLNGNYTREGSGQLRKRRRSGTNMEQDSHGSPIVPSQTSARSLPTGSSQSSQAKGLLPSELVSHLIPEQVNGFTYDRSKHQWVKGIIGPSDTRMKADDSEDDPFKDISDLSVDESDELMTMQAFDSSVKTIDPALAQMRDDADYQLNGRVSDGNPEPRPQTREGERSANASTLRSKVTRFTSSVPNTGTRATSWSTEDLEGKEHSEDVEHEIQLHEGRLSQPPNRGGGSNRQPRVVTISFSSPAVSHVTPGDDCNPAIPQSQIGHPNGAGEHRVSIDERSLVRRFVSRIDDRNEEASDGQSLIRRSDDRPLITTNNDDSLTYLPEVGQGTSCAFELSTLSEFTVDQVDHPLHPEVSYVDRRTHPTSLRQVHGRYAMATEDLVKHITDVEPHELFWEDLRRLILRDKGLNNLYKLGDFCPRLEDLDVSDNDIEHLSGVPFSLRTLKIPRNLLSSRTAWGHLTNLQYLDISGNELENLHGFHELIHLRELKANDNQIRNIDGILDLNGLLSLKLSNNLLSTVHFEGTELTRLRELDLSDNQLTSVTSLDSLPSLEILNLNSNKLSKIDISTPLRSLRSLKLLNNRFSTLDVSVFPSLTLLYLDQNFLSTVSGLGLCHHLEVLSVREQRTPGDNQEGLCDLDLDLGHVKDIRKVFLSSNRLSPRTLSPSASLLGLQLLDIASCAIHRLPADFSVNFPNLKVLNLNFNSLTGIEELVGTNCLSRLGAAGNRIVRMRRLCQVLSRIGKATKKDACSLREVDLRGNPLTVGFYAPLLTGSGRSIGEKKIKARAEEKEKRIGVDFPTVLANLQCSAEDMAMEHPASWGREEEIEVDDPYTLPPADVQADRKYLSCLDGSTKLRRRVLELMLYAGSGGSIRFLDGLELHPGSKEDESDLDQTWAKLEELGVLKRKRITE